MVSAEPALSATDAAKRLGITIRALYRLVDAGTLPAIKANRRLQFRWADVERMRSTAAATAEALRDRQGEKERALEQAGYAAEAHARSLKARDATIVWVYREHNASLRELAEATGLPTMTVKRIIDRVS